MEIFNLVVHPVFFLDLIDFVVHLFDFVFTNEIFEIFDVLFIHPSVIPLIHLGAGPYLCMV